MEKSLAEGSMTFEQDIARMIDTRLVSRDEGLAHADSPTNLMWRLQNDTTTVSRAAPRKEESDQIAFTEFSVDIYPEGTGPRKVSLFDKSP